MGVSNYSLTNSTSQEGNETNEGAKAGFIRNISHVQAQQ